MTRMARMALMAHMALMALMALRTAPLVLVMMIPIPPTLDRTGRSTPMTLLGDLLNSLFFQSSNLANKLDPRVDSDRDNRNDPTSRVGGYGTQDTYGPGTTTGGAGVGGYGTTGHGATGVHHGPTGTTTGAGLGGASGAQYDDPRSTNTGPHR